MYWTFRTAALLHMASRKQTIEQLERETARLEQRITSECVEIGKRIAATPPDGVRQPELKKYLHNIRGLRRSIDDIRAQNTRLEELYRRARETGRAIEEGERLVRERTRKRASRLSDLGAGAYALYRRLDDRERYSAMFDEVLKLDTEIDKLSSDLAAVAEAEKKKGFFERLRLKTKKVMLRGNISKVEKQKLKAYARVGERVAESDFAARATGELASLFEDAAAKRRAIEDSGKENERRREELESLRAELKEHGCEDGVDARRKETDEHVRGVEKELEVMYCWTGQLYIERDLRREIPDDGIEAKFEIVGGMRESIRKHRGQVVKLRA
ncbi:MAG: hypothetical protein ACYTAF_15130, partial [Planctomycetota bacterium]